MARLCFHSSNYTLPSFLSPREAHPSRSKLRRVAILRSEGILGRHSEASMKHFLSWAMLALIVVAAVIYLAGSSTVDFIGFKDWTKNLGAGAGVALAILFLVGGVY